MRLLLSLPLGILIGMALGALGGGGSILAVPALVYVVGLEPKSAVTTSLVVVGVAALGGMIGHWRGGRVRLAAGLWFGIAGIAGSLLGSRLNRAIDPTVLLVAFSGLMLIAAWRMWVSARRTSPATAGGKPTWPRRSALLLGRNDSTYMPSNARTGLRRLQVGRGGGLMTLVASFLIAGTAVGFLTGFFGVGGGFIIVPTLVLVLGFDMPEAVGTSLLIIAINSGVALASRLATTGVDWRVAVPFTGAALIGALVGNRVAGRLPSEVLVRWFAVLLVVVATYTVADSLAFSAAGTHGRTSDPAIGKPHPHSPMRRVGARGPRDVRTHRYPLDGDSESWIRRSPGANPSRSGTASRASGTWDPDEILRYPSATADGSNQLDQGT